MPAFDKRHYWPGLLRFVQWSHIHAVLTLPVQGHDTIRAKQGKTGLPLFSLCKSNKRASLLNPVAACLLKRTYPPNTYVAKLSLEIFSTAVWICKRHTDTHMHPRSYTFVWISPVCPDLFWQTQSAANLSLCHSMSVFHISAPLFEAGWTYTPTEAWIEGEPLWCWPIHCTKLLIPATNHQNKRQSWLIKIRP